MHPHPAHPEFVLEFDSGTLILYTGNDLTGRLIACGALLFIFSPIADWSLERKP